jgi:succinate-acetate transporter protein
MSADTAAVATTGPVTEPTAPPTNPARPLADPLPLGLGCFGVSVLLLAITQAGLVDPSALPVSVLAVALTADGLSHVIAGLLHFGRYALSQSATSQPPAPRPVLLRSVWT